MGPSEMMGKGNGKGFCHGTLPPRAVALGSKASQTKNKPSCRVWPNGEFSLGWTSSYSDVDPLEENLAGFSTPEGLRRAVRNLVDNHPDALDLTSHRNSHNEAERPETYGRKGLTNYGAKVVRNAAYLLQREVGKDQLTFLTLTLPAMSPESAVRVASQWGELVRQLNQWLSRQLSKKGLPTAIVSVTECQTHRLKAGDAACLHLHAVFQGRDRKKAWALAPKQVRNWWTSALSRVAGVKVYSSNCVDMKRVQKDASNYLSKYMSKGVEAVEQLAEIVGWDAMPRQWWSCTADMRERVSRETLKSDSLALILEGMVNDYFRNGAEGGFKFVRAVEIETGQYTTRVVGFWGKLTRRSLTDLTELAGLLKSA